MPAQRLVAFLALAAAATAALSGCGAGQNVGVARSDTTSTSAGPSGPALAPAPEPITAGASLPTDTTARAGEPTPIPAPLPTALADSSTVADPNTVADANVPDANVPAADMRAANDPSGDRGATSPTPAGTGQSADVPLRRIGQWTNTGIGETRRMVIRDANTWAAFWTDLGVSAGARPDIDFTRDAIIAVAAGQRRTGGYGVAISRISRSGGDLTVEVTETVPGPNCITTQALTQPVDVVAVPAAELRGWSFVEKKEIAGC